MPDSIFRFNSKLVRLKAPPKPHHPTATTPRFNSKLVRLKVQLVRRRIIAKGFVSIPNWCD